MFKHVHVRDPVLPPHAKYASEAAQMETIQSPLLDSVCCPSLTGAEACAQDVGFVHLHLGFHFQAAIGSHPLVELGLDC